MKVYLLCSLNDENYRHPVFEFFDNLVKAHQYIKAFIADDIKDSIGSNREIKYGPDINTPENCRLRVEYSYDNNEHFIVFEVFEIEISDGDCLCMFHHAYDGVGFCVEKIGTFEECRNQMLDSAAQTANDFNIDITDEDVFEVNEGDSCVDTGEEWHMCDIIQFNKSEIKWR